MGDFGGWEGGGVGAGEDYQAAICARELKYVYHGVFFFVTSLKTLKKYRSIKGSS